jgi:hypothetical protein
MRAVIMAKNHQRVSGICGGADPTGLPDFAAGRSLNTDRQVRMTRAVGAIPWMSG